VVLRISKQNQGATPELSGRLIESELTVYQNGTDPNAPLLSWDATLQHAGNGSLSDWLSLAAESGTAPDLGILVRFTANAARLYERAEPYTQALLLNIVAQSGVLLVTMPVFLYVNAEASAAHSVWGSSAMKGNQGENCTRVVAPPESDRSIVVGDNALVMLQLCDSDSLPVRRRLFLNST
jgi:hypothetical protein